MTQPETTVVDTSRLSGWLAQRQVPFDGDLSLTLIAGGRSNLTYRVEDESGHQFVLRRPPRGALLQSAHDVGREHRIISALEGTGVPVAHSYGLCQDPAVFGGAPFYLMNLVPGVVLNDVRDNEGLTPPARARSSRDLISVLARIHLLDVDAVGLGDLSRRRDHYCSRQLRRWLGQFQAAAVRDIPLVKLVHDRLVATVPPQRWTGLVHGDYRPGNVLLGPTGSVNAVLDWELATLGDTLADLGWLLATWAEPGETQVFPSPTAVAGWATRSELAQWYSDATGRDTADVGWYQAFALWRLTCISEGIYIRYRSGAMGDDGFDVEAQGRQVLALAEAAHETLRVG